MIFLTVGTILPFDRLVRAVDDVVDSLGISNKIFAQIGRTNLKPRHFEYTDILDKRDFSKKFDEAEYIISHAGVGSIVHALERNKRIVVMPRMRYFKEHVNNHQVETAEVFEKCGHILVAYKAEEIPEKLKQIELFNPEPRMSCSNKVVEKLEKYLESLTKK